VVVKKSAGHLAASANQEHPQNPTNSVHLRLLALLFPGGLHSFCYDRQWSLLMSVQRGRLDEMLRASMHRGRPA